MAENHSSKYESKSNVNSKKSYVDQVDDENQNESISNKINLDYDWNTEYGDGDIPDVDKL